MFKSIAEKVRSEREGNGEEIQAPQRTGAALGELGLLLGANLLAQGGVVSERVTQRLQQFRPNPEAVKVQEMLLEGRVEEARKIATDPSFIDHNNLFINSGQLIRTALDQENIQFAYELIEAGYKVPKTILIDAIHDRNETLISTLVNNKIYNKEHLEVEFWHLLYSNYLTQARKISENEPGLSEFIMNRQFDTHDQAQEFIHNQEVIDTAITHALTESHDHLAMLMLSHNPKVIRKQLVYLAIQNVCLEFLKLVWTGNYKIEEYSSNKKRRRQSLLWDLLEQEVTNNMERRELARRLKIAFIVNELIEKEKYVEVMKVFDWPGACDEPGVMKVLIRHGAQSLAQVYLSRSTIGVSSIDLEEAIKQNQHELCIKMLTFKEALVALDNPQTQEKLIALMDKGESCLAAAEMLNRIPMMNWHFELTKDFCLQLNRYAKKSGELLYCPAPLLFWVLTAELLKKIGYASFPHQNRCYETAENFLEFGMSIEKAIKDEEELKYFLTQTDSRSRAVLSILSKNRFYTLLEPDEVGTIVSKMWMGSNRNYGIIGASTVYKSLHSSSGTEESMGFSRPMDMTKPYMFHFEQWTESNYYRYNAVAFSTFLLVVFYQMVIYSAIEADSFEDVTKNPESLVYLRISQVWIVSILIENFLYLIFGKLTGRGFQFNGWRKLDLFMFLIMGTLTLDLHKRYMGQGNELEDLDPVLFNAGLHSVLVTSIWIRLMSVLITSKRFGPLLRMIYLMSLQVINFFIIYICLELCAAAVFTAMFNKVNVKFRNFSTSIRILFAASLANFDLESFEDNIALGGVMLCVYLLIAYVMLLNLLIALLSNVYSELITRVDSEHRAVVIGYYDRLYWDKRYGFLIFLPPPFTFITILFAPAFIFSKDPKKMNKALCKFFYFIYAVPQFLYFFVRSMICWFFLYFKGFVIYGKTGNAKQQKSIKIVRMNTDELTPVKGSSLQADGKVDDSYIDKNQGSTFNCGKAALWTIIGMPWTFWSVLRDCGHFWKILYFDMDKITEENEKSRVQQAVNEKLIKDLQNVIKTAEKENMDVNEVYKMWQIIDPANENPILVQEYLIQFADSYTNNPTINIPAMSRLLPKRNIYNESYMIYAQHINVPWIKKGMKKYKQKTGSIVEGSMIQIPKDIGDKDSTVLKRAHIEELSRYVRDLETMYKELNDSSQSIRNEVNTQNRMINTLRAKRQDW